MCPDTKALLAYVKLELFLADICYYSRKMNRNEIGVNAGKVWQLLSNNEKWSYGLLKRKSGLKDKELGAALGWLSRENKIEFDQCDEELYVYLCVNVYIG